MNRQNRERVLTITALICLAALAGDTIILTPLLNVWEGRAERIEELNSSLTKGQLLLARERNLRRRWREMQRDSLPEAVSAAEGLVLNSMDRWVNDSRVNIISLKPQWKTYEEKYRTLECTAIAQGTIREVARFLYELEKDPLCIKVEKMEINARDNTGQALSLGITFSGVQFLDEERSNEQEI